MVKCARCRVDEKISPLFDVIYEGALDKLCENCAKIEGIPVIKKPSPAQIQESERFTSKVYERMKKITGYTERTPESLNLSGPRKDIEFQKSQLKENEKNLNLITNFHWIIMNERRHQGLTSKQLAEKIHEPEEVILMIEKGRIPVRGADELIKKIESTLKIFLRNIQFKNSQIVKSNKPILLDENGNELDKIPEEDINPKPLKFESGINGNKRLEIINNEGDLDLKQIDSSKVDIALLRDVHRKKIEATKQEKLEEQKKIEERQRLIEARKEDLRSMREKQSKDLDDMFGGTELIKKGDNE